MDQPETVTAQQICTQLLIAARCGYQFEIEPEELSRRRQCAVEDMIERPNRHQERGWYMVPGCRRCRTRIIERLSRELEAVVDSGVVRVERARELLGMLAKTVAAHFRREENFIYPGLTQYADPSGANDLVSRFEELKADWEQYIAVWQRDGALRNWQRFGAETHVALQTLRERALQEVRSLYVVGVREGLVSLHPIPAEAREKRRSGS